jgi:1-acyl-sn-glycerol-3-phosphate acyltransferase
MPAEADMAARAQGAATFGRQARGLWRLLRTTLHVFHGVFIVAARFRRIDAAARMGLIQWWSAKFLRLLGVRLVQQGTPQPGAKLLVANHISWLDILAIDAVAPARFVSKSEVRHWPVLGWLVTASGTLYIERERPRDALRVVHQMAAALQAGDTLAVFPEGTTGDGHALLPFHANLLQGAIATATPVQPIGLRFSDPAHAVSPVVCYLDDTTLLQSVWSVVCADGLSVRVLLLPALAVAHADRRQLAQQLRLEIEAALGQ